MSEDLFSPHPITEEDAIRVYDPRTLEHASKADAVAAVGKAYAEIPDKPAQVLYAQHLNNAGVHSNRLPSWNELSDDAKEFWRRQAETLGVKITQVGVVKAAEPNDDAFLKAQYPDKSWPEIIAILLEEAASEHVAAGQFCKKIDEVAAEATKLSTAAEAMFEEDAKMRREFGAMIRAANAKRDRAIRLIRRGL